MMVRFAKAAYWLAATIIAGALSIEAYAWVGPTVPERLPTAILCGLTVGIVWLMLGAFIFSIAEN
jgi:hypothetical protein